MSITPPERGTQEPGAAGAGQAPRAHGFPSPARDYLDGGIDLNRELVRDRTAPFLLRVAGQAMTASSRPSDDDADEDDD